MSHERRSTEIPQEAHREPGESRICVDNVCASTISKTDRARKMFTSHERWWTSAVVHHVVHHAPRGARGAQVYPIEMEEPKIFQIPNQVELNDETHPDRAEIIKLPMPRARRLVWDVPIAKPLRNANKRSLRNRHAEQSRGKRRRLPDDHDLCLLYLNLSNCLSTILANFQGLVLGCIEAKY